MNEEVIRALVREVVGRHLGAQPADRTPPLVAPRPLPLTWHPSHARYAVSSGEEADGPCFIEPAVRCNHCGYCQSHGH